MTKRNFNREIVPTYPYPCMNIYINFINDIPNELIF